MSKRVPKLRFPEFEKDGEWEEKRLGKIGDPLMCKRIFKDQTTNTAKGNIPFYKIGTFGKLPDSFISFELYNEFKSKYSFPKVGDILISASGTIGRLVIYDGLPAYFQDSNIVWLGNDEKQVLNSFLFYCYSKVEWQTSDGGVIKRLYNTDLKNIKILFPKEKREQEKIADCMLSLDELIEAQIQKVEALKQHKTGLIQQLFPQEGETVPKLRFPEFRNEEEWDEKIISDIGKIVTGKTPNTSDETLWNGNIQFVTPTDINEEKYQIKTQRTVKNNSKIKILPKNSIMFTCIASIGKMALSVFPCITNQQINTIIPDKTFNNEFIYYALLKKSFIIKSQLANTTLPIINKTEFSKFSILIPKAKEQEKIADCLSSLDELIEAQTQKLEALKQHKKGLMQQLFPSEEI